MTSVTHFRLGAITISSNNDRRPLHFIDKNRGLRSEKNKQNRKMSYEQNLGLDGYSFEPEYSENELETLDRTLPYEDEQIPLDEWCDCGNCEVMEKTEENVCCRSCDLTIPNLEELDCITDHEQFDTIVLNPAILEVSYIQIMMYKGQRGRAPDQLNNK